MWKPNWFQVLGMICFSFCSFLFFSLIRNALDFMLIFLGIFCIYVYFIYRFVFFL